MCKSASSPSSGDPSSTGSPGSRHPLLDSHTSAFHAAPSRHTTGKQALGWRSPATALFATLLLFPGTLLCVQGATLTVEEGGPIPTIQDALDIVQPGDTISISSGNWYEDLETKTDGTASNRITIKGDGGKSNRDNVILRGAGTHSRVFQVKHDYYTLKDFTIDGKVKDEPVDQEEYNDFYKSQGDNAFKDAYRDILLYVTHSREATVRDGGYRSALDGLEVKNMVIKNAGGECIRLRHFVTNADIAKNEIITCGLYDYVFRDDDGENGEGIYIGTARNQWDHDKTFSDEPDQCSDNVVRGNVIMTNGNEGVDVKAGSVGTVIKNNKIHMQLDVDSGGINSNGDMTIVKNNFIINAKGAGVRLGGYEVDGVTYGLESQVFGNTLENCLSYGVKVMISPQGKICENDIILPPDVDEDDYRFSGGDFESDYPDPRRPCDD